MARIRIKNHREKSERKSAGKLCNILAIAEKV
jgi:hypothetical protein